MINRQNQESGDGSTNLQAQNMTVVMGVDEKRAREIFQEMSLQQRNDYSQEALIVATERVEVFENTLMEKMEQVEGALEAFADPSFQILLVEAQKTAASSERVADYDMLSELLIHRFQKGENRKVRAGINRAVEIVDEISDDALRGLTVFHSISYFYPVTAEPSQALDALENLFEKLCDGDLPKGDEWLDHLDILDAARLNTFIGLKTLEQYYPEKLAGFIDVGIKKDSDNHNKAIEILKGVNLSEQILVQHAFDSDYLMLPVPNQKEIASLTINHKVMSNGVPTVIKNRISDNEIEALNAVYSLYENNASKRQANIDALMNEWDKRPHLKALKDWWNELGVSVQITAVGKVLAHSNAQRCDKTLPPLN
ncbi:LPO_1073/Vpar_1526 family protein [Vibrio parahaemolyticus]|uniref:LPO_1073/Vpar_1526 family protein n=1 Tax=Vibrio sp. E14 TaxID=2849869 RepID=UPI001CF86CFB|nr:LPO_1073/Vpar_1526 family protein [Vibrio sp. E14]EHR6177683.1 hypothetical protein [Vibrio parahaemolyticus]